jgi:RNA methyltransferase, TrmH family
MITKSQIQFVQSLKQKKYRDLHRCFVAEGSKLVLELAESRFSVRQIFATTDWLRDTHFATGIAVEEVKPFEMERISALSNPSPVLAIVEMQEEAPEPTSRFEDLTLVLDGIQDPGNMGTIIRIADWFGIREVICSTDSVDLYNSKVIQATMGSITRVKVNYVELAGFFEALEVGVPVYGMMLEGENLYTAEPTPNGMIVIGSEAHGISHKLTGYITHRLTIPFYPADRDYHAESLNAAVATGIVCAEFRKRLAISD